MITIFPIHLGSQVCKVCGFPIEPGQLFDSIPADRGVDFIHTACCDICKGASE